MIPSALSNCCLETMVNNPSRFPDYWLEMKINFLSSLLKCWLEMIVNYCTYPSATSSTSSAIKLKSSALVFFTTQEIGEKLSCSYLLFLPHTFSSLLIYFLPCSMCLRFVRSYFAWSSTFYFPFLFIFFSNDKSFWRTVSLDLSLILPFLGIYICIFQTFFRLG
jgi:hypothetical protein